MKLLRLKHVIERTGLSRATIYRMQQLGTFPPRRRISLNAVAWVDSNAHVVLEWNCCEPVLSRTAASSPIP